MSLFYYNYPVPNYHNNDISVTLEINKDMESLRVKRVFQNYVISISMKIIYI